MSYGTHVLIWIDIFNRKGNPTSTSPSIKLQLFSKVNLTKEAKVGGKVPIIEAFAGPINP